MQPSCFHYPRALLLPVLAFGLILAGCDSSGSNGNDEPTTPSFEFAYPSNNYGASTVVNLLAFDLGVRAEQATGNPESTFLELYTGGADDEPILATQVQNIATEGQSVYGDIAGGVDLSALVNTDDLIRGDQLDAADTPNDGAAVNTDELLRYYFQLAGAETQEDVARTDNGFVLNQFAEKMLLGTPLYEEGATILSNFADGSASSADQWDMAFGYFGFPRSLEPFLDYANGTEGLADAAAARDVDENGSVDLTSEYIHTWASYAIERAAAAENNGQPNDFARDAFNAFVQGREAIENGNDPSDHAQTALEAWEATVAVNVIHYINSMRGDLASLDGASPVSEGDISEDAWGEAKAFAWNLQFYSDTLTEAQLNTLHELIGNDPPYGELTASEYLADLDEANQLLEDAYGFNASNVDAW